MGSGAKVVLVALLIIMVVVVAKVVQKGSDSKNPPKGDPAASTVKSTSNNPGPAAGPNSGALRSGPGNQGPRISQIPRQPGNPQSSTPGTSPGSQSPRPPVTEPKPAPAPGVQTLPVEKSGQGPETAKTTPPAETPGTTLPATPGNGDNVVKGVGTPALLKTPAAGAPSGDFKPAIPPAIPPSPGKEAPKVAEPAEKAKEVLDPFLNKVDPPKPKEFPLARPQDTSNPPNQPQPGPKAAPQPGEYTVRKGDGFWRIAETVYGPGKGTKFASLIQNANKGVKLIPGKKIQIPALPVESLNPPPVISKGSKSPAGPELAVNNGGQGDGRFIAYTVQKGDTWTSIAARFLKDPNAVSALKAANRKISYETLRADQVIQVPRR